MDGSCLYQASCFEARCVPLAQKDARLLPAERQALAETYTRKAVALLRKASHHGCKVDWTKESFLEPLHAHPEFARLLQEIQKERISKRVD
jgi:hypothetical protein